MVAPHRFYIDGKYGQIHVRVSTPGNAVKPPLYLAHQSPKNGREFERFMNLASQDRVVVAPDYRGYGM